MTLYARFYGKRTWHIVEGDATGDDIAHNVNTVCGEPSILVDDSIPVDVTNQLDRLDMKYLCERCEKRNP